MKVTGDKEIVIGIDPGTEITGYGIIACDPDSGMHGWQTMVDAGIIRGGNGRLPRRLEIIHRELKELIDKYHPSRMAIEQLYAHHKHPRTSITMAHSRGVILLAAEQSGLEINSYPATEIKRKITGNGRASKERVRSMVVHLLNMKEEPQYLDISDALAVAITDIIHHQHSNLIQEAPRR